MIFNLNFSNRASEWTVYKDENFCVQVRSWAGSTTEFNWNVYAYIYDSHPLFSDVSQAMGLPFHGGATFDKFVTDVPARGLQYSWQKEMKCLKIGSDYSHYGDHRFTCCDPIYGIPNEIELDVGRLVSALHESKLAFTTKEIT